MNNKQKKIPFNSLNTLIQRYKEGTFQEIIDDWKWIFNYSRKYKKAIIFYVFLGILSTTMGLVSSVASKYLIDIITGFDRARLSTMIAIMVGSAVFNLTFSSFINRLSTKLSVYINNDIQSDIFDQIMDADWLAMNAFSNGDVLNRFNTDVNTVADNAVSWLPTIIIALYNFLATFVVLLYYDMIMAMLAMLSAPFLVVASQYLIKKQREYGKKVRAMNSEMMTFEIEAFYNFDTIKSFGITKMYSKKMRQWQMKYRKLRLQYNLFTIETNILLSVLSYIIQFIAFGYALYLLWNHSITYGTMVLFLEQRTNLSNAFNKILSIIPAFLNSSISAHRIRELTQLPKEEHKANSFSMENTKGYTVSMDHVDFAYEPGKTVITDSQFIAKPGEIVALVGPSGGGKTTMIRLILGLVHPQNGQVTISSETTVKQASADLRSLFAYVPQGNTILSGTIRDNLLMVKENATDQQMIEALQIACAWDFVQKKEEGLDAKVGERGKGLSEGQAQRIAIARAVLRDAPILLMDESTSALDVTTERQVLRNIIAQKPNKTCIITTHRPSALNLCQRIYRVVDTQVALMDEKQSSQMVIDF